MWVEGHQCGRELSWLVRCTIVESGWLGQRMPLRGGSGAFHLYFIVPRHMQGLLVIARQRSTATVAVQEVSPVILDWVFSAPRRACTAAKRGSRASLPLG